MDPAARQRDVSPMALTGKIIALNGVIFLVASGVLEVFGLDGGLFYSLSWIFGMVGLLELLVGLGLAFFRHASPSAIVVNQFYAALAHQDFMTAFQCLNSTMKTNQGEIISLDWFIERARANDSARGLVTDYRLVGVQANPGVRSFRLKVTRGGRSYRTILSLRKLGYDWKITGFERF